MSEKIHGASHSYQNVTGNIEYYTVYCSCTNIVSDPQNATGINITVTGNITDETQKNFEVLIQSVGLRAMPVIMSVPTTTTDLDLLGAPTLTGEGFIWKFAVEFASAFENYGPLGTISDVGFLVDEIHNIVLPSGEVIKTKGIGINMEFVLNAVL